MYIYVYIYIYIYMCMCVCVSVCPCMCACLSVSVCHTRHGNKYFHPSFTFCAFKYRTIYSKMVSFH